MKRVLLCASILVALAFPATGISGDATTSVSCTDVTFFLAKYPYGTMDFTYTVTVDGETYATATQTQAGPESWLTVPLTLNGRRKIDATISWTLDGGGSVSSGGNYDCGTPYGKKPKKK